MDTAAFLSTVITCPTGGYFCLAVSNGGGGWLEHWYRWPEDLDKILDRAKHHSSTSNVYFSSYLFNSTQSLKSNVLPSKTIQADLDDADVRTLPREPTVLIETSPKRHQGYWVLDIDTPLSLEEHEELSKKLTYSIPLCDRSGWPLGRKVRLPHTKNFKYLDGPKHISIANVSHKKHPPEEIDTLPEVPQFLVEHYDEEFINNPKGVEGTEGVELLEIIKDVAPVKVYAQYHVRQPDRSEALWSLMCWGFKAGLNRQQVFTLAKGSANDKFADLKHRANADLAKDVLRAEHTVRSNIQDDRQVILELLKAQSNPVDRHRSIFKVVLNAMKSQGEFLHTQQGMAWYIRRDQGKPISISPMSQHLQGLLDIQFGLNPTEGAARYVIHGLTSYAYNLPQDATQSALSHYDSLRQHMLLHTGQKSVLQVTASAIETCTDGAYKIIFPWIASSEHFTPDYSSDIDWGHELFGNSVTDDEGKPTGSSVDNITNMTPQQAMALLKVWLLFVLFRNAARSRPIIAALGQPGSGKSLLFKKVYCLLYGPYKGIGSVTREEDFDFATAYNPLHVIDNVDTWEHWLPDRMALAAGVTDITSRKKYTDGDMYTLRRQAVLGVTAHNPKFGREDVADRFLMLSYQRLEKFASESEIIDNINKKRNKLWGAIINDIQRILTSPIPTSNIPQFRIEDFARYGLWIARAIGVEANFRSAVEDIKTSQQSFSLEEEGLLVSSVLRLAERLEDPKYQNGKGPPDGYYTTSQLWSLLQATSDDVHAFDIRYKSSINLSKKLSSMQPFLSTVVDIQQKPAASGGKSWRISTKNQVNQNVNGDSNDRTSPDTGG